MTNELKQDDVCMQCGHTRTMHNMDGCMAFGPLNKEGTKFQCGCVLDDKQGKEVKL